MTLWHLLVDLGQWTQTHQELVLSVFGMTVLMLALTRWGWRTSVRPRRPRL
jgi:hypothetical protein